MTHSFFSAPYSLPPSFGVEDDEYLTVPDMSLSVQEILSRFTRGTISLDSYDNGLSYTPEDLLDDSTFDNVDDLSDLNSISQYNTHKLQTTIDALRQSDPAQNISKNDVNKHESQATSEAKEAKTNDY